MTMLTLRRIVLMGQGGVGKTALVTRFNRDEFDEGVSHKQQLRESTLQAGNANQACLGHCKST